MTLVSQGLVDHSDCLGAAARFGGGDAQWLPAGRGIVHAEMFPLLDSAAPNPLELFQIWLNLPARSKMAAPHFTVLWSQHMPRASCRDAAGRTTEVVWVAGRLAQAGLAEPLPPPPPPDSWASQPGADRAIWTLKLAPRAQWTLPEAADAATRRMLYCLQGASATVDGQAVTGHAAIELRDGRAVSIVNGLEASEFLLLKGRPIGEPVAQHGPFVMNTQQELRQAFDDYRRTGFGGWPWPDAAPVHGPQRRRFARHADGRVEFPEAAGPV